MKCMQTWEQAGCGGKPVWQPVVQPESAGPPASITPSSCPANPPRPPADCLSCAAWSRRCAAVGPFGSSAAAPAALPIVTVSKWKPKNSYRCCACCGCPCAVPAPPALPAGASRMAHSWRTASGVSRQYTPDCPPYCQGSGGRGASAGACSTSSSSSSSSSSAAPAAVAAALPPSSRCCRQLAPPPPLPLPAPASTDRPDPGPPRPLFLAGAKWPLPAPAADPAWTCCGGSCGCGCGGPCGG